ncbi:glycosyltransferase [Aeromonas taiwanensis]|uniref:glycosyltransferase n=1 Tax=Aeromonas taiwanensis TaxID=633417 RepID=UPI0009DD3944|nr:glycosyltransferase [Aeromonas taiwanensis]
MSSAQGLVSILIPVFNHEKYIEECLTSIINLTYANIEVLICDDGSIDNSLSIVKSWCLQHPGLDVKIFSQENKGVCHTLNRLLNEASGEFITICASDDALLPDSISLRLDVMRADPTIEAVIGDAVVINGDSAEVNRSAMKSLYNADFSALAARPSRELVFNWSVVGPTLLAKRSLYDKIGMYDPNLLVEDRDFYLRCLAINSLRFVPDVVAKYRVHSDNVSRKSLAARANIWYQVALSNVKNARLFNGIENVFLRSHRIDLFLLSLKRKSFILIMIFGFRAARRMIFGFMYKTSLFLGDRND